MTTRCPKLAFLLLLLLLGCSQAPQPEFTSGVNSGRGGLFETPAGSMTFFVRAPTGELIDGVLVMAVNTDGLNELGRTEAGRFTMRADELQELRPYVMVFCHREFPCSALIVGEKFFGFRDHNVRLAPFVIS